MLGTLRRLANLARGKCPRAGEGNTERAAMRSAIRADGNSRINPMGGGASSSPTSGEVWQRVIDRMNSTN